MWRGPRAPVDAHTKAEQCLRFCPPPRVSLGKWLLIALKCHLLRFKVASSSVTSCHSPQNNLQCDNRLFGVQIWGLAPTPSADQLRTKGQISPILRGGWTPCRPPRLPPRKAQRVQDRVRQGQPEASAGTRRWKASLRQCRGPEDAALSWRDGLWAQSMGQQLLGSAALSFPSKNGR